MERFSQNAWAPRPMAPGTRPAARAKRSIALPAARSLRPTPRAWGIRGRGSRGRGRRGRGIRASRRFLYRLFLNLSRAPAAPARVGDVIDAQRHALEPVGLPQPVLEVERPRPSDQAPVVHLDGEAGWPPLHLGRVVEPEAPAARRGRRAAGDDVGDEAVELRRG